MADSEPPLRVLHVGNVANNAYLNARLLRLDGVDCDVLAYAHYHVMGWPEWEASDFRGAPVDEERPDFRGVDLRGFTRPRWFAHGPFQAAAHYLEARRRGAATAALRWRWLEMRRDLIVASRWAWLRDLRQRLRSEPRPVVADGAPGAGVPGRPATPDHERLIAAFRQLFPDRRDQLSAADIDAMGRGHGWTFDALRRLFGGYDLVHAYGAEPILPALAGFHPAVAFEHGTIRVLPFEDSPLGRMTALAYRLADHVIITNADNRTAAERLGIERYRFVPHPVSEDVPDVAEVSTLAGELRRRLDADFVVFHPSRQHWHDARDPHLEKGNDRLIDGLARLFAERPRAGAVFVAWGQTIDASRARLAARGIAHKVLWIDPVPGPALARYMAACDVVADQFFLGSFGGITPRALFLGTPALLHLDVAAHRWCFPEPPPVLNACGPDEIAAVLRRACDDVDARTELGRRGQAWYARHHASAVVRQRLLEIYRSLVAPARVAGLHPYPA